MLSFENFLIEEGFYDEKPQPYENWLLPGYILPFPASRPMVERIVGELEQTKALHVTNFEGLEGLGSIEGTAKQLSVFTLLESARNARGMAQGVATSGGIIVELEGKIVVLSTSDVWSGSDADGTRWFDLNRFDGRTMSGDSLLSDYTSRLTKFRNEVMDDYLNDKEYDEAMERTTKEFPQNSNFIKHAELKGYARERNFRGFGITLLELKKGLAKWSFGWAFSNDSANAGIIEDFDKAKKGLGQLLYRSTKKFYDLAEDTFKEWKGEFITLFVEGDQRTYNEGIMTQFMVTGVYYNIGGGPGVGFDMSHRASEIREIANTFRGRPEIKGIQYDSWPSFYEKWKQKAGKNNSYYLGRSQEEYG